jgi:hypothetical protein
VLAPKSGCLATNTLQKSLFPHEKKFSKQLKSSKVLRKLIVWLVLIHSFTQHFFIEYCLGVDKNALSLSCHKLLEKDPSRSRWMGLGFGETSDCPTFFFFPSFFVAVEIEWARVGQCWKGPWESWQREGKIYIAFDSALQPNTSRNNFWSWTSWVFWSF